MKTEDKVDAQKDEPVEGKKEEEPKKEEDAPKKEEDAPKKEEKVEPVPVAEVASEANKQKRAEAGIKIRVGENTDETKTEPVNTQDADMVESGYIESDNPYLYDTSGVNRRTIDYGQAQMNADLLDYDLDKQMQNAFVNNDGSYSVKNQGEKFKIGSLRMVKEDSKNDEDKEMAKILEQIRQMEDVENLGKKDDFHILEYLKQGDFIYELFSILIHSGSAMGGHYYAYIRSFQDGKWYKFNDSTVTEIPDDQVKESVIEMYGGETSTSAYMLQYRKYDPALKPNLGADDDKEKTEDEEKEDKPWQNIIVGDDLIPDYLKEEIEKETNDLIEK